MATKQAEINFADMSIDEMEAWQKEQQAQFAKFQQAQKAKIEASKQEAFDELAKVVDKYRLGMTDIINSLLKARKIDFNEIKEITPIYLVNANVRKQKRNAPEGEMEDGTFKYYEGKTLLADKKQAEQICANGVDEFKKVLTEDGKRYLEDEATKHIILDFYNSNKPQKATEWK